MGHRHRSHVWSIQQRRRGADVHQSARFQPRDWHRGRALPDLRIWRWQIYPATFGRRASAKGRPISLLVRGTRARAWPGIRLSGHLASSTASRQGVSSGRHRGEAAIGAWRTRWSSPGSTSGQEEGVTASPPRTQRQEPVNLDRLSRVTVSLRGFGLRLRSGPCRDIG